MSLLFQTVCALWQHLVTEPDEEGRWGAAKGWFERQATDLMSNHSGMLALLSCLFPDRRPDRVYGLREKRLTEIAIRAWGFGAGRANKLRNLQPRHAEPDFATAVRIMVEEGGEIMHSCGPPTVEEVNETLDHLASTCSFSSLEIRLLKAGENFDASSNLINTLRRMCGLEAEWMFRLILGDLGRAQLPEEPTIKLVHPEVWRALRIHDSFGSVLKLLDAPNSNDGPRNSTHRHSNAARPQAGVLIRRPAFAKARSIQHCGQLLGRHRVSVERKYDGEYCQIHVQLLDIGATEVTIFSKSGRDSTVDRGALIPTVIRSLGIGSPSCKVKQSCVLVGELLVWNDAQQDIVPFYKIRRYVRRAGRRLGCARDSPPLPEEHLMVVFFDILLLDDTDCVFESYEHRRQRLRDLLRPIPGHAVLGEQVIIDFRKSYATVVLTQRLAYAISRHWEGLVLKRCGDPYVSLNARQHCQVKLKKDFIPGLGDSADLVAVGGAHCGTNVTRYEWWTKFYLACVDMRQVDNTQRPSPIFRIVATVSQPAVSADDMRFLNRYGKAHYIGPVDEALSPEIQTELADQPRPAAIFMRPLVVEVVGAGFDRLPNSRFESLRFPRIVKIHQDRSFHDATTTKKYCQMAKKSREYGAGTIADSYQHWLGKLSAPKLLKPATTASTPISSSASQSRKHVGGSEDEGGSPEKKVCMKPGPQRNAKREYV